MRYLRTDGTGLHHIQDEESEDRSGYEAICGERFHPDHARVVIYLDSRSQPTLCADCQRERQRWDDLSEDDAELVADGTQAVLMLVDEVLEDWTAATVPHMSEAYAVWHRREVAERRERIVRALQAVYAEGKAEGYLGEWP